MMKINFAYCIGLIANIGQIKTQKSNGGAKRRHYSFGFYALSKTCIAVISFWIDTVSFMLEPQLYLYM